MHALRLSCTTVNDLVAAPQTSHHLEHTLEHMALRCALGATTAIVFGELESARAVGKSHALPEQSIGFSGTPSDSNQRAKRKAD